MKQWCFPIFIMSLSYVVACFQQNITVMNNFVFGKYSIKLEMASCTQL